MFKDSFFRAFAKLFGYLPTQLLVSLSQQKLIVPLFHTVSDVPLLHIKHIYSSRSTKHYYSPRSTKQFRADIAFFLKNYQQASLSDIVSKKIFQAKEPHFFLTFDDGLSELYHIVMPILQEKGLSASIFLNPDFVDNKNLFYRHKVSLLIEKWGNMGICTALQAEIRALFLQENLSFTTFSETLMTQIQHKHIPFLDILAEKLEVDFAEYLSTQKPYLSLAQIQEMQQKGFSFGAHSVSHPQYSHISLQEQIHQTQASVEYVLQNVPNSRHLFAFPFTDFGVSQAFFDYFQTQYPLDCTFACAGLKKQITPFHIQRIECEKGDYRMEDIVNTEYVFYLLSALVGKHKILPK